MDLGTTHIEELLMTKPTSIDSVRRSEREFVSPREVTDEQREQIRRRAYELYEQRGREDGHQEDDWRQAEKEVLAEGDISEAA